MVRMVFRTTMKRRACQYYRLLPSRGGHTTTGRRIAKKTHDLAGLRVLELLLPLLCLAKRRLCLAFSGVGVASCCPSRLAGAAVAFVGVEVASCRALRLPSVAFAFVGAGEADWSSFLLPSFAFAFASSAPPAPARPPNRSSMSRTSMATEMGCGAKGRATTDGGAGDNTGNAVAGMVPGDKPPTDGGTGADAGATVAGMGCGAGPTGGPGARMGGGAGHAGSAIALWWWLPEARRKSASPTFAPPELADNLPDTRPLQLP